MLYYCTHYNTEASDYLPVAGLAVEFSSAPSQECIQIDIVDDSVVEQNEEFEVEIDSPQFDSAVSLGTNPRATVLIVDNGKSAAQTQYLDGTRALSQS